MFCKKVVLRNVKVVPERSAPLERLWHRCFPTNFVKFLRAPVLKEHLRTIASVGGRIIAALEVINSGGDSLQ